MASNTGTTNNMSNNQSSATGSESVSTRNVNVIETQSLISPKVLRDEMPISDGSRQLVLDSRQAIKSILEGEDKRLLVVVGPCSIHDEKAAIEYAQRLANLHRELSDHLYIVMRVYFEKPRTTIGWKGLINDPHLNGTFDIDGGLHKARQLLLAITELGLPVGTEMLEPITPQYIADLVSWASIGARTTESQTHRQMASGLSMPVGFKNATDGNVQVPLDAMLSSRHPHAFLGIDDEGRTCVIKTRGNAQGHLILRGGRNRTNFDADAVAEAAAMLQRANLPAGMMIDCSHANSEKQFARQEVVWNSILDQRTSSSSGENEGKFSPIIGAMLESNLNEGNQKLGDDPSKLNYGVSITDPCISWERTEALLREAAAR